MKKFLLSYWLGMALLFTLFYWDNSPLSFQINNLQTNLTAYLTSLSLPYGMMEAHRIFISEHYTLVIEKACNGMIPYLFFIASIAAFPSTLMHKIKWAVMGYILITSINVLRIWLVSQFVLEGQENFSFAHDYLGNGLLILTGLILFTSFIKTRQKKEVITQENTQPLQAAI